MVARNETAQKVKDEQFILVPLKDIDLSFENSRSGNIQKGDSPDGKTGQKFSELVEGIEEKGQLQPGVARPKGKKFQLVAGFRRYLAIKQIAQKNGDKNPVMKLIIKEVDDINALEENLGENAREGLTGPDLGYSLWRLSEMYRLRGNTVSDRKLASIAARNHTYVSDLMSIFRKAPKVAKTWHDAPVQLSVANMLRIAKLDDKGEQMAEYKRLLAEYEADQADGPTNRGTSWTKTAIKQGERTGAILGKLARRGCITLAKFDWAEELENLGVRVKKDAKPAQRKRIGEKTEAAYQSALTEVEETAEEGSEEAQEEAAE